MSNDLTIQKTLENFLAGSSLDKAVALIKEITMQREAKLREALSRIGNMCPMSNFQDCSQPILAICKEALSSEYSYNKGIEPNE